jgi:hypothetical protein
MTDTDASVPTRQVNSRMRQRCVGDGRHDATARCHLSEHGRFVLAASINCESCGWDDVMRFAAYTLALGCGQGRAGGRRSGFEITGTGWLAIGHAPKSNQPGVASTYSVFDTPTISFEP